MKPLVELDATTCRSLAGVAFDVDDTVTRRGRLELSSFKAMHLLAAAGLKLVAVTGRPLGWADVIAQHWPVDLAVGENGAGWVRWKDPVLHQGYFESDEARSGYSDLFERVRRRVKEQLPHVMESQDQRLRRCDLAFDVGETVQLPDDEIEALVKIIEAEGARAPVSSVHAHAIPGGWNKARGIERAARDALRIDLATDKDRWLFIGDSTNDASAFAYFPVSVGVANVESYVERLPTPPAYITRADRGEGFAEMVRHVLRARAQR